MEVTIHGYKYSIIYYIDDPHNIIVMIFWLQDIIEQIIQNAGTHVICGDFNYDLGKSSLYGEKRKEIITQHELQQSFTQLYMGNFTQFHINRLYNFKL